MKIQRYISLIVILVISIILIAAIALSLEFTEERLRILIRWSAKISVSIFSLAFASSSLHYFFQNSLTKKLLEYRAELGLAFATFHTAHLIFLLMLQQLFHPVFTMAKTTSLIGGGAAYLFMFAMAITTFPGIRKKLKPKYWRTLHLVGSYWIWLIFFRSYLKNVIYRDQEYILFIIISLAMLVRLLRSIGTKLRN